jgi:glyoxylase-like metal-dependent hydrolase (beta-lactamase superfamily II)
MHPPPVVSLFAVSYGKSHFARKYIFSGDTSDAEDPFDWLFYVLRTETAVMLIDTGFRNPTLAAQYAVTIRDILLPLNAIGIQPQDVTDIVITHADFDHSDNVDLFPNAQVFIQQDELERILRVSDADASAGLAALFTNNPRVHSFTEQALLHDVLHVEKVGGHTIGSSVVWFAVGDTTYIIPGDECYVQDNAKKGIPIGYLYDLEKNRGYVESLSRLQGAIILPFHDPSVLARYPNVAEGVAQIL